MFDRVKNIVPYHQHQALGASIGNFLEFYNFIIYAFFAPMIGEVFFSAHNPMVSLICALLTFSAGYIARPLGSIYFGFYVEKHGSAATLSLTFILMGISSLFLVLTPGVNTIGYVAPILVVVARVVQGFSEGGDVGPSTDLLFSQIGKRYRSAYIIMQPATQYIASFCGVFVGLILSLILSKESLYSWGWRIPFAMGILIVPVGFWIRSSIPQEIPLKKVKKSQKRKVGSFFAINMFVYVASGSVLTYIRTFGVSYAVNVLGLPTTVAMAAMSIGLLLGIMGMLISMKIHAKIPAKKILLSLNLIQVLSLYPAYYYATHLSGIISQIVLNTVLFLPAGLMATTVWSLILESLPKENRSLVYGITYTLAVCLFGGVTQPIVAWLIAHTGSVMIPAYVGTGASIIGSLSLLHLNFKYSNAKNSVML